MRQILAAAFLAATVVPRVRLGAQPPPPVAVATRTTEARREAARMLVPLLDAVRRRAKSGVAIEPGALPDSPFTGRPSTLFAFALSKRSVAVDTDVVEAMGRLLAWNFENPPAAAETELFDEWLDQLMIKSAFVVKDGRPVACDASCVVSRMTTLDDSWGGSPRHRAEARDAVLLDALVEAVNR